VRLAHATEKHLPYHCFSAQEFSVSEKILILKDMAINGTFLIIYMKKFLHSDWLRAENLIQCKKRKQAKHSDWSMIKETQRWPIKSFAFKSSARPGWRN